MDLAQLGEFGLIDRIRNIVGNESEQVIQGIGDDAAVFESRPGWLTIFTTDALVQGVHFDLAYTPFDALGWKALAINLSDVAAMGGKPRYALVSIAMPDTWAIEDIELLYQGLMKCGKMYGCEVIGGDTTRSDSDGFLSVSVIGDVKRNDLVTRSGAHKGDLLCVLNPLGRSRVGLDVLRRGKNLQRYTHAINHFLYPEPKVREARSLIKKLAISSMIDISDGLGAEIHHICRESDLGCVLWKESVPIAGEVVRWVKNIKQTPFSYALESGEEYDLLFTVQKESYKKWEMGVPKDLTIVVIGEMVEPHKGINIKSGNQSCPLSCKGWDHFRR